MDGTSQIYIKYGRIEVLSLSMHRSFQKVFILIQGFPLGGQLCHTDTFLVFDLTCLLDLLLYTPVNIFSVML